MIASISEVQYGTLRDGRAVKKYTLRNSQGAEANFVNLGAAWIGFKISQDEPNLVLGGETLEAFDQQEAYLGATVGRFANRVGHGQFTLNGKTIQLDQNLEPHCLHGGFNNLSNKIWKSHVVLADNKTPTLTFSCESADGESGFPGNVSFKVVITLTDSNDVRFEYFAETDQATIINLTNHSYFNLDGAKAGSLTNHQFKIASDEYLAADETGLPTGKIIQVEQTPMDFRNWGSATDHLHPITDIGLRRASGYDHCYVFPQDRTPRLIASARSTLSNRQLDCTTDLPGMQFYTGNFLGGTPANATETYQTFGAFCFEPGFWPDSPNHAHFPNCFIDENTGFAATITYTFK